MKIGIQDLDAFLLDFGDELIFENKKGLGILDTPDQIFIDGQANITLYQVTFKTSDFALKYDSAITIEGVPYKVKEVSKIDDGSFSKAFLEKE